VKFQNYDLAINKLKSDSPSLHTVGFNFVSLTVIGDLFSEV
jgi:hypothetical protein